jgi:hypothetical protein
VRVKTPYQRLVHLARVRFGFPPAEAEEVAHKAEAVLAWLVGLVLPKPSHAAK